jgi:hypothetical protein
VLLFALLLQAQAVAPTDSTYSTTALRSFVGRASRANRAPPLALTGYNAKVETELAFILRDSLGREDVGQIEQLAARAEWERAGRYELHVVGYRAQNLGAPYSALTFTRMFTTPTLYGNRLAIGMNDGVPRNRTDSAARRRRLKQDSVAGRSPLLAVHPLSTLRDRYYRFTGGDTVAAIFAAGRTIRVVRVMAQPIENDALNYVGFEGELDFDAERYQLVRMRGRFVEYRPVKDPLFVRTTGAIAMAYIEFENVEVGGKYWLPAMQRSEFQAQMGILGDVRPIYRIVTRFRDYKVTLGDTLADIVADSVADADSTELPAQLPPTRSKLTYAPQDSVSGFGAWEENLGSKISSVGSNDFDDLAPDVWKPTGRPSFSYWPNRLEDMARYNRVEGLFTGVSGTLRMRDVAPGLTLRGIVGFAWEEQTIRGGLSASLSRRRWIHAVRAERTLAVTDDFLDPLDNGLSIGPLLSAVDDRDYLDRWSASVGVTRVIRDVDRALITTELAMVRDRPEVARLVNGIMSTDGQRFRPNRSAFGGDYARGTVSLEYHPRVTGIGLSPGIGARITYEVASGNLNWQRIEARLAARQYWHGLIFASRVDAGAVVGDVLPPQTLYEIGGGMNLPSYGFKEFGGDRAVLGRGLVAYQIPVLRAPMRVGRWVIPGISPGLGAGVHGGWTGIASSAARTSLLALGGDGITPLSVATGRVRATADVRLTLLSGTIGGGMARPLDHTDRWRPFFVWGASF